MARTLIPCYGTSAGYPVSDVDTVVAPGRVAHQHVDGTWVRVNPDGSVGSTPADKPVGAYETAGVNSELRIFCPSGTAVFAFRMTDPGTVPNL